MKKKKIVRLSVLEASEILGISPKTLYDYMQKKVLPSYKLTKGSKYVLWEDLNNDDFLYCISVNHRKGPGGKNRKHLSIDDLKLKLKEWVKQNEGINNEL